MTVEELEQAIQRNIRLVSDNLDCIAENHEAINEHLRRVKAQPWRKIRNQKLLTDSQQRLNFVRRLQTQNDLAQVENSLFLIRLADLKYERRP